MLCGWLACGWFVGGAGKRFVAPSRLRGPGKTRLAGDFRPPFHGRRDPWKEARPAGAWMPDAFFSAACDPLPAEEPIGQQASSLIPRRGHGVAVDSQPDARRARRVIAVSPRPQLDTAPKSCFFLDAVCFARGET